VNCALNPDFRDPEQLLDAWWSLEDVATAVVAAGVRCTVLQAFSRDAVYRRGNVTYRFFEASRSRTPGFGGASLGWVRRMEHTGDGVPDIVHLHGLAFPLHAVMIAKVFPTAPLLAQDHASQPPRRWRRYLHRWAFRRLAGVGFTAAEQARAFIVGGVLRPGIPVFQIPEGTSRFTPGDVPAARQATGLYGNPCLVWLGNLDGNKDPLTVLEALRLALSRLPDPHLWCLFRAAPLLEQVQRLLRQDASLAPRVHLLGARPHAEIELFLRAADFLVQGSHREGSGYAVIEALACGRPALVTDIPAFRTLTGNGAVAALSPPGNAPAMANALVTWWGKDAVALRHAARAHFERTLSLEAVGAAWRQAYESTLSRRP
jgi:glycosyltransferase involved in cell wall biosynthesis